MERGVVNYGEGSGELWALFGEKVPEIKLLC